MQGNIPLATAFPLSYATQEEIQEKRVERDDKRSVVLHNSYSRAHTIKELAKRRQGGWVECKRTNDLQV